LLTPQISGAGSAALCSPAHGPALLVRVTGLKSRAGTIRVRTFAGNNPKSWFDKKARLARVVVPAGGSSGPVDVCVGVPRAGGYVIDIRHDINANDDTDKCRWRGRLRQSQLCRFWTSCWAASPRRRRSSSMWVKA
jgi:uncharacterized protein (DUF2141 family)